MHAYRTLVIGGYGFFGARLVQRLATHFLEITVAGRSKVAADALIARLAPTARARLRGAALDIDSPSFESDLRELHPQVVVHTSGPFQGQDYRVARACILARAHYIDLADGREFVAGIQKLDAEARAAGVLVTSGASSVPALSSAAVDRLVSTLTQVDAIDIRISPGNKTERGLATVRAILSYCGAEIPGTSRKRVVGWGGARRHQYSPPVGSRLLSPCDVPDLALLAQRYPGSPDVRFNAGLELGIFHRGMNVMSLLRRVGLVADWSRYAVPLKRIADWFLDWGSDHGAMHVTVTGRAASGEQVQRTWELLATKGDGPFVPTLAASALVRKLSTGDMPARGALPCVGLLTLNDFEREMQALNISMGLIR